MPGPALWGANDTSLLLQSGLQFKPAGPAVLTGTTDPTSSAVSATQGSLYLNSSNGNLYKKNDNGSTTNWTMLSTGGGGSTYVRSTRFVSIGAGTSGTVTKPTNSTIILDDFGGTVSAVICQISGGFPLKVPALDSLGSVIATTFDASGNWSLSGTPASYPIALVYRVRQPPVNYDDTSADIWGDSELAFAQTGVVTYTFDGQGGTPDVATYGYVVVPYDCTITSATLLADQSGSFVVEVWKAAYSGFPPTSGNKISASAPPTLSSAQNAQDKTLTGWSTGLKAGDVLAFNVTSSTTVNRVNLILGVKRA